MNFGPDPLGMSKGMIYSLFFLLNTYLKEAHPNAATTPTACPRYVEMTHEIGHA